MYSHLRRVANAFERLESAGRPDGVGDAWLPVRPDGWQPCTWAAANQRQQQRRPQKAGQALHAIQRFEMRESLLVQAKALCRQRLLDDALQVQKVEVTSLSASMRWSGSYIAAAAPCTYCRYHLCEVRSIDAAG